MGPFASSSLSNQLTLPTLLWIRLHKFTMYTEIKSGGFRFCYHRQEITFQLKTTTLFAVREHGGNSQWMTPQFHKGFRPVRTCAAARRNGFPPLPPAFPSIFWHNLRARGRTDRGTTSSCILLEEGNSFLNREPFSNATYHAAIQPIPSSSREGETLMLHVQVYASFRRVGSNSQKNGRQSFSFHTTDSN